MVEIGQGVKVRCECTLDDGRKVDVTDGKGDVFDFVLGDQTILHAISSAVSEMEVGASRDLRIEPEEAFGVYDESLLERVPASLIPHAELLPVGRYVEFENPYGNVRVKVVSANADEVVFDHNHELADEPLNIHLELLHIRGRGGTPLENELDMEGAGCGCGCDRLKHQLQPDHHHGCEHAGDHDGAPRPAHVGAL